MSQQAVQAIAHFENRGEPSSLDMPDFPDYNLQDNDVESAMLLVSEPARSADPFAATHALLALLQRCENRLVRRLLQESDETLLTNMVEIAVTQALPYFDTSLLQDLESCALQSDLSLPRRLLAVELTHKLAMLHPGAHARASRVIENSLTQHAEQPKELNAALVDATVMLQADDLLPLVEDVYAAQAVDISKTEYASAEQVKSEMEVVSTSFDNGLSDFMHFKELDEVRVAITPLFVQGSATEDFSITSPVNSISELDGLLHAVCISPELVDKEDWQAFFTPLLRMEMDSNEVELQMEKLMTYYSEVSDSIQADQAEPYFEPADEQKLDSVQPWACGFLKGFSLWLPEQQQKIRADSETAEFIEFLTTMVSGKLPDTESYQLLEKSDFSMITAIMLQRFNAKVHGEEDFTMKSLDATDLDDTEVDDVENALQSFFDQFADDDQN
ncbi:hypothetical protein CWE09_06645 [Aliidiomarina minuta]|uniref:Uncharacterized protein n=1 Tax=Aliidiomarina minuta TaxID=880057 RepID=A0A432W8M2_9GAMM|nr:UPF0149 family protein [Aliidiomarina minuta]RUO26381.1 hypothetical protein CWE09_06645 [Aliidiomarina minuta]